VSASDPSSPAWDDERDVVVIGSGAGGLTGAVVAATGGADVLVLEKTSLVGGTTSVSGGGFWIPLNHHMAEEGVDDSRDEALAYLRACAAGRTDDDILEALVDNGAPMVRLLEDRVGLRFRPWPAGAGASDYRPWLPGAKPGSRTLSSHRVTASDLGEWEESLRLGLLSAWTMDPMSYYRERMHLLAPSPDAPRRGSTDGSRPEHLASGTALIAQLLLGCLEQGVTVWTDAPATELLVEGGRVVGVKATRDGEECSIRARAGVLVASGGFGHDPALVRMWLNQPLEETCESDGCTGDGQLLGAAVGAQLGQFDAWWMPHIPFMRNPDGSVLWVGSREDRILPHTMWVNGRGRRFVNEATNYYDVAEAFGWLAGASGRNLPAWLVFDEQGRERYMLLAIKVPDGEPPEWLATAATIEELAARLPVDPAALRATVERFNDFARTGVDEDFGRGDNEWDRAWGDPDNAPNPTLGTIEKPPFYALEVRSGALGTRGGLRVNGRAEVISARAPFDPIPGLYAAGNCCTGAPAGCYPGAGSTIGAAMTFGYLAALALTGTSM